LVVAIALASAIRTLVPLLREYVHVPEREWPGWRFLFGRVPQLVPVAAYTAIVLSLRGRLDDASAAFFSAATEVIAILLLALLLEAGTVWIGRIGRVDALLNSFTAGLLVLGLFVALYDLAESKHGHADIVYASIGAGVAGILVAAILGRPTGRARSEVAEPRVDISAPATTGSDPDMTAGD
jgi:hypothetical protein